MFYLTELPPVPSDSEMEVASLPSNTNLPPVGHKPTKKEAKLMQQRLERLAKVNIHLHGKINYQAVKAFSQKTLQALLLLHIPVFWDLCEEDCSQI